MKYSIGREILKLIQTENHLDELSQYYTDFLNGKSDMNILNEEYIDDHSLLYMSVQHLAPFNALDIKDLMGHYIGFSIKIVKREKIFDLLRKRKNFTLLVRESTKTKIFEILNSQKLTSYIGTAEHYFLASKFSVFFDIEADIQKNEVLIKDIYVGDKDAREEYYSAPYKPYIGLRI